MGSANAIGAVELLERLFAVVIAEAKARPQFAAKLISALPQEAVVRIEKPQVRKQPGFDPNSFSLVAVFESEGERGLRQRLNALKNKQQFRNLAAAQHIAIESAVFKKSLARIKDALVEGVKLRIGNRLAAAS